MLTIYQTVWASTYAATFSGLFAHESTRTKGAAISENTLDQFADVAGFVAAHAASRAQAEYDKRING